MKQVFVTCVRLIRLQEEAAAAAGGTDAFPGNR